MLETYRSARTRHAGARLEAYAATYTDATPRVGTALRLADIDRRALDAWRTTWRGRCHPSGVGGWSWPELVYNYRRRAAVLPLAIWYAGDLCGLALGYASRHRMVGARHTITLSYVERRPEPPRVPLHGFVIPLAVAAARNYGLAVGASRLRLAYPDRNLLGYYAALGFAVAWEGGRAVYCEQEI
ncbi:MAG TPA: hypothetical protein VF541_05995, partial [Longimicrobium sp.]